LLLLASLAHADDRRGRFERFCSRTNQGRTHRGLQCDDLAFFEAFPANGAGTTGVCSTTAPTGAKGETLTFTRGSTATCTKTLTGGGLATTGIANGDLVVLSSNVARVEYDSAGTLGLLVESSRTNDTLRSQEFSNAYWTNDVVPTADFAVAPDGTTTAERFQFGATSGATRSVSFVSGGCTSTPVAFTQSIYVRGTSASGTMDLCGKDLATSPCVACSFTNTSWTRCTLSSTGIAPGYFMVGNASQYNGGVARSANDVLVWGAQCEIGAYSTSYIPTTSAAVTRSTESANFTRTFFSTLGGASLAVSTNGPALTPVFARYNTAGDTSNRLQLDATSISAYVGRYNVSFVGPAPASSGTTRSSTVTVRSAVSWNGTDTATLFPPGAGSTPATSAQSSWTGGELWLMSAGAEPDGIVSRLCLDPVATRCR